MNDRREPPDAGRSDEVRLTIPVEIADRDPITESLLRARSLVHSLPGAIALVEIEHWTVGTRTEELPWHAGSRAVETWAFAESQDVGTTIVIPVHDGERA